MGDANEYLKLQEIADKYRVNQMTVRRWIKAGHLPAMKVGKQYRIQQSDVDAFLTRSSASRPIQPTNFHRRLAKGPNPQPEERKA